MKARIVRAAGAGTLHLFRWADRNLNGRDLGLNSSDNQQNPYAELNRIRTSGPVLRSFANRGWVILGFDEVQAAFKDTRFGSDLRQNKFLSTLIRATADGKEVPMLDNPSMLNLDAPAHTRLRKLVSRGFLHKYIQSLEPAISRIVARCLDGIDPTRDSFDLVADLAQPLPAIVIAEMLGLPEGDRAQFHIWSNELLGLTLIEDPNKMTSGTRANVKLVDYFAGVIEHKRRSPGQDLIGQLIAAEEEGHRLTADEMYATCVLLLTAGHETTTRLIANGMYTLLLPQHVDQLMMLQQDPTLAANAIEEMLRFEPPMQLMPRVASQDIEFCGQRIKKNQLLLLSIAGANRDEAANDNPNAFDITRESIKHISFGHGIHLCLGLSLARLAINALLARFPQMTLADAPVVWTNNQLVRGMENLQVSINQPLQRATG